MIMVLLQPIEKQTAECMKLRKELKDTWSREQKKLSECKAAMKASKSKYTMLGQELSRVSPSSVIRYLFTVNLM